jgi:hypothetical protein
MLVVLEAASVVFEDPGLFPTELDVDAAFLIPEELVFEAAAGESLD